jgi:hypothetical protein
MGSMAGTFTIPEFNSSYTITDSNLVRIGDKKFLNFWKKIYLDFSVLEKFAKKQKIHIFGSHSKKWVQWPELLLYLNSTHPIQ